MPFVFSFTFLWLFNKIISCPCSTDIFSGFGFGRGHEAEIDVVFSVSPPSRGKKLPLLQMPENANIAKKKPTVFCSFCLAFAFILSTEYAWPFCSVVLLHPNNWSCSHNYSGTSECQELQMQNSTYNRQLLVKNADSSINTYTFGNLTYAMHLRLVCFHLVLYFKYMCTACTECFNCFHVLRIF